VGARTKARKRALDVLFEADQRGSNAASVLDARILLSGRETSLPPYAIEIVRGVVSRWVEINAIIQDASPAWTIARMPVVDRGLLRIATWEILCNDEVPVSVAINEAVTLATGLSTDNSPSFINGLLSTIAKDAPALSRDSAGATAGDDSADDDEDEVSWGPDAWGLDEPEADEPEADADFADDGLSDEVAKMWAEGLLGGDAVVVPMPESGEEPVSDESVSDAPVPDESASDETVSDEPVPDEPVSNEPVSDEPVSAAPESDESVSDDSVSDGPVSEEIAPGVANEAAPEVTAEDTPSDGAEPTHQQG
jgi:N utilization substance protein B